MRLVLLALTALVAIAAPAWPQAAGPIKARPRPSNAPRTPQPPPPRIGERPVEYDREPAGYAPPTDPVLVKAIEANKEFGEKLPNFLCRQYMTRSSSRNLGQKWKEEDVVETEVLIIEDREEYRDIKIDGRPTGAKDLSQIGGAWSMGEYGAVLWNIFLPASRAQYTAAGSETIEERVTAVYDYKIEQENSRWTLRMNGQEYSPGHHGKIWIDLETGRALRIAMEATYLPASFPANSATERIEFSDVEIDGQKYLLPTIADNQVCIRDSARCLKIRIEFRDYRKFTADSTIVTTDSEIDFGQPAPEEHKPPSEPKP